MPATGLRLGIDLGGTKIAGVVLDNSCAVLAQERMPTPVGDYQATVAAIVKLVLTLESAVGVYGLPIGMATPGATSPATGLLKNANSTCLNGRPLQADVAAELGREIRVANDADCLAVSEATDGAATGARSVFAVILGTGVGGGFVYDGQLLSGPNAIVGEWGHTPLPWPNSASELPGSLCWCGRQGCIETWLSGPAMAADYCRLGGEAGLVATEIAERAARGQALAQQCCRNYEHRLARGLASVINIIDPEVIVLGGGLSRLTRLYENVPKLWAEYIFSDTVTTRLVPAQHGDASGVRGAAWLNNED